MKLILLITVLFIISFLFTKSSIGFGFKGASPLNPSYDGTTLLVAHLIKRNLSVKVVLSDKFSLIEGEGLIILISPEEPLSSKDVSFIKAAFRRGYSLLIADESAYSNTLLNSLKVPIRIASKRTMMLEPFPKAIINVKGMQLKLELAYASFLKVWDKAVTLGWSDKKPVFAVYKAGNRSVYVLSDGSVFTNAAFTPLSPLNPYVRLLDYIVNMTYNIGSSILIYSVPYDKRPLSMAEMFSLGYGNAEIMAGLLNPYRYGRSVKSEINHNRYLFIALTLAYASLAMAVLYKYLRPLIQAPVLESRRYRRFRLIEDQQVIKIACKDKEFKAHAKYLCSLAEGGHKHNELLKALNELIKKDEKVVNLLEAIYGL